VGKDIPHQERSATCTRRLQLTQGNKVCGLGAICAGAASNVSANQFRDLVLVGIAHDPANSRQGSNFFRRALGVAAGHQDLAAGVGAMNAADGGASILVGGRGDGAGVQHHYLRLARLLGPFQPLSTQLLLQGSPVRLGGAAAKVLHVETGHGAIIGGRRRL